MTGAEPPDRPAPFNVTALPDEIASEISNFIRSYIHDPSASHVSAIETRYAPQEHKDNLQDIQSQISSVIEPTATQLLPLAEELQDMYEQIDLLEHLIDNVIGKNVKDLTSVLERTEQAVRCETRALDEGRFVELWKGVDMGPRDQRRIFKTGDHINERGRLKPASRTSD